MSLKKFLSDLSAKKFDSLTPEEITSLYNAEKQERANKVNPRSDKQKLALIKDDWRRLKKQVKKDGQIVDGDKNEFKNSMEYIKVLAKGLSPTSKVALKEWFANDYYSPKAKASSTSVSSAE